jgi:tetratricopeptide (TPR) repeat protein
MVDLRPGLSSYARVSYYRELTGDFRGAVALMRMAAGSAGGDGVDAAWANYQLGELYFGQGDLNRAEHAFEQGAYLAPRFVLPKAGIAQVAAARGHASRAIEILSDVVRRYPLPKLVATLGDLYRATGRNGGAERQYELVAAEERLFEANGVRPDADTIVFYADHHMRLRHAVAIARRAYRRGPSVRVCDALAWALYATGQATRAERIVHCALRLGTRDALYYFHAGMIAKAVGRPSAARRYLATALEINPHFSLLYSARAARVLRSLGGSR